MCAAIMHRVADRVARRVRSTITEPTEWQRIGNQIDAAMIFTGSDFVNLQWLHRWLDVCDSSFILNSRMYLVRQLSYHASVSDSDLVQRTSHVLHLKKGV